MPTGHEFTVGTTPVTVFQRRGCGHTRAAEKLVVAPPGVAVLSGGGAAPRFPAIWTIERRFRLGEMTRLEEESGPPLPTRSLMFAGVGAALTAAEGSRRET